MRFPRPTRAADLEGVDHVDLDAELREVLLYVDGDVLGGLVCGVLAVEHQAAPGLHGRVPVVLAEVRVVVDGHVVCLLDQVGARDGRGPKAEMGNSDAAGLVGIVGKVPLSIEVRGGADDLDGFLVGPDGSVGPHAQKRHWTVPFGTQSGSR